MRETHVYVGRDRECGCVIGMFMDDPVCLDDAATMVKADLAVDRVTAEEARKLSWGHKCGKRTAD